MGHVPGLVEVVTGRGDRLGFDVDIVVGADGEIGAYRPTEGEREEALVGRCDSRVMAPPGGQTNQVLDRNVLPWTVSMFTHPR